MRNKTLRVVFWSMGILTIGITVYYGVALMTFQSKVDSNYTREELTVRFNSYEYQFEDLISFFGSKTRNVKGYSVRCQSSKRNKITLFLISDVINNGKARQLGGSEMDIDSKKLDSALLMLHWKRETVIAINKKLSLIGFNHVSIESRTGNNALFIYPAQSGWCSFEYKINNTPLPVSISNRSISKSKLEHQIELVYSCAL